MQRRKTYLTIALTVSLLSGNVAQGQTLRPAYLSEMPAPARILNEIKGKDAEDTIERQMGSFILMKSIIDEMAYGLEHRFDNQLTPDEERIKLAYHSAYADLWHKAINKELHKYDLDRDLRNELVSKLFSQTLRDLYFKSNENAAAYFKQYREKNSGVVFGGDSSSGKGPGDEVQKLCAAKGLDAFQCLMQTSMSVILKAAEDTSKPAEAGLTMSGVYQTSNFRLRLMPERTAWINCGSVFLLSNFSVEKGNDQLLIKVRNSGSPFVLRLQPDGKTLMGPGLVSIIGNAPGGSSTTTNAGSSQQVTKTTQRELTPLEAQQYPNAVQNGQTYSITETTTSTEYTPGTSTTTGTYHPASAPCRIATLSPAVQTSAPAAPSYFDKMFPPDANVPDGLRMIGTYDGPGQANVKFEGDKAIIGCHATLSERPYNVSYQGGRTVIEVGSGARSQKFILRADGTLSGDGSPITLIGKRKTGENALGDPTYTPGSDTCTYGNLVPHGQSLRANNSTANDPISPPNPATQPVKKPPTSNSTTNETVPAVLNISSGFGAQPNPLAGRELIVLNQSWEDVLRKAGFQDPPRAMSKRSAVAIWAAACQSQTPACKQGIDAMKGSYVGKMRLDATGRASVSGMPRGSHWLVGLGAANSQHFVWNLQIDLKPGSNSIEFDPRNATLIY